MNICPVSNEMNILQMLKRLFVSRYLDKLAI